MPSGASAISGPRAARRAGDRAVGRGLAPRRRRHLRLAAWPSGACSPAVLIALDERRPREGIRAERPGVRPAGRAARMRGHARALRRAPRRGRPRDRTRAARGVPGRVLGAHAAALDRASGDPQRGDRRGGRRREPRARRRAPARRLWARSARATRRSACWSRAARIADVRPMGEEERHARFSLASGARPGLGRGVRRRRLARTCGRRPVRPTCPCASSSTSGTAPCRRGSSSARSTTPPLAVHGDVAGRRRGVRGALRRRRSTTAGPKANRAVARTRPRAGRPDPGVGRGFGRRAGVERASRCWWSARTRCGGGRSSRTRRVPRGSAAARRRSSRRADRWRPAARPRRGVLAGRARRRRPCRLAGARARAGARRPLHARRARRPGAGPRASRRSRWPAGKTGAVTPTCSARTVRRGSPSGRWSSPTRAARGSDVPIARWPSRASGPHRPGAPARRIGGRRASRTRRNGARGRSAVLAEIGVVRVTRHRPCTHVRGRILGAWRAWAVARATSPI